MAEIFCYSKHVAYHETDSMGVVHHSNYIKFFEEARVAWLRSLGLISAHAPMGPYIFAVVDLNCQFLKPSRFEDKIDVWVQARLEGARIRFRYAIWLARLNSFIATGETVLVPLNSDLRPARLPTDIRQVFDQAGWAEQWPPTTEVASC